VYSPHEYGPGVFNMPYFSDKNFPKNLVHRWQIGFNYITSQNIAPILIGEFGGKQVDNQSQEGIWQNELVKYIQKQKLSFAYWSWNPNSADTGGILTEDWQSINIPKQQLISQLLPIKLTPEIIEKVNGQITGVGSNLSNIQDNKSGITLVSPSNSSLSVATTSKKLQVQTDIYSDWETGFCINFKISNQGEIPVRKWQLSFQMREAAINDSWNANFIQQTDGKYIANPLDWGAIIEKNQVRDIGFCANKLGLNYRPIQVQVKSVSQS
jgi:endoglucanase